MITRDPSRIDRRSAWLLVAIGGSILLLAATLGGRGPLELAVAYRTEFGEAPCPPSAAAGAQCTSVRVVNASSEPHEALCRLVGGYRHAWLSGGDDEIRLAEIRPWQSAPFIVVVAPNSPDGSAFEVPGVRCVAG
jgi:hypothetical protein